LGVLAEVHSQASQFDAGWSCVTEALAGEEESGRRDYEAELHRLKGTLVLQSKTRLGQASSKSHTSQDKSGIRSPESEAEECFLQAIDIARKQQAKSLELRATMSLARLWQQQGKQHEARNVLLEIYGWFTEGFDTKDLQEAKRLIEVLS